MFSTKINVNLLLLLDMYLITYQQDEGQLIFTVKPNYVIFKKITI